jgi:Na+/melibiose symporter-like transporter
VVGLPKAWDVVVLPVVGRLSDRHAGATGSRIPFLVGGGIALVILFVVMFAVPPALGPVAAAGWVFVAFVLSSTAFAFFQVPYIALSAELTKDAPQRATLMGRRVVFLTVAILLSGAVAPLVRDALGGGYRGYLVMAVAMAALMGLGIVLCIRMLRPAPTEMKQQAEGSFLEQARAVGRHRPFVLLLSAFFVQALATAAMLAAAQYYATYVLHRTGFVTILFVALVAPAILVMPMWSWVARTRGKKRGFVLASLLFLAGTLLLGLMTLVGAPLAGVLVAVVMCGVAYAGMQMFPLSMLPDTVAAAANATGEQRSGVFTGFWTAGETLGFAIGPALVLAVLALSGFVSSSEGHEAAQPSSAITGVGLTMTLLPAALTLLSFVFVLRYDLDESTAAYEGAPAA